MKITGRRLALQYGDYIDCDYKQLSKVKKKNNMRIKRRFKQTDKKQYELNIS